LASDRSVVSAVSRFATAALMLVSDAQLPAAAEMPRPDVVASKPAIDSALVPSSLNLTWRVPESRRLVPL